MTQPQNPSATTSEADGPTRTWGFLGAGKMASALVAGMIRAGVAAPGGILLSDPDASARSGLAERTGAKGVGSNLEAAQGAEILVLAVKPQVMSEVLREIAGAVGPDRLVVSIAAGVTLARLEAGFGEPRPRFIRVMPNTPALIGQGASAYCLGPSATEADEAAVRGLLEAVGTAHRVPERLMDAVTGLSGSGPAFVYTVIEALADGGVRAGLPRNLAAELATQTVLGSARLVQESGRHPASLRDDVTSPGGTTIAGQHALERGGLRAALIDAVVEATERSTQLLRDSTG